MTEKEILEEFNYRYLNFKTYFLSNDRVLDNRENYTKIKIVKY